MRVKQISVLSLGVAVAGACLISSCGSGSGGGGDAVPAKGPQIVQGTAAVGGPISNGNISLKCALGERSAVTEADGRYKLDIAELTLPCTMALSGGQVRGVENTLVLMSPVMGSEIGTTVVNLTPWTHLVMARLMHAEPQALGPAEMKSKLLSSTLGQANEGIRQEMARLFGNPPDDRIDPISTPFVATSGDSMADLLSQIMAGLAANQKTLAQAAQEVATGSLLVSGVPKSCKPGVFTGFASGQKNMFNDALLQVPPRFSTGDNTGEPVVGSDNGGGGGGGDGGGGGGDGAGSGGSLGQFLNTVVIAERADGSRIGRALTGPDGLVTVVTCGYAGPVHLMMKGRVDNTSQYYEESTGKYAPFLNTDEMHSVVPSVKQNMGITLLTEAAWQYMLVTHGANGWKNADNVTKANNLIGKEFNKFLPKDLQISDITRLPFLVSNQTKPGTLTTTSANDIYGIVSSGLARAAGLMRDNGELAPALKLVRQLGKDLCDGVIDFTCNGVPVAEAKDAAYFPPQFGETLNRGVGDVAANCGAATAADAAFRVTQMTIGVAPSSAPPQPNDDPANGSYVSSYHDNQPIHLLRSDGKVFYWHTRASPIEPFLADKVFNRIFPQNGYEFAGVTSEGEFFTRSRMIKPFVVETQPQWRGATTVAGFSATGYSQQPYLRTQIARLPSGEISYFPHYEKNDPTMKQNTKVIALDNVTAVSVAGGESSDVAGDNVPTFYALKSDGSLYAWGNDRHGALGDKKFTNVGKATFDTSVPQRVLGLPPVVSVASRLEGAFAVDAKGHLWRWGHSGREQSSSTDTPLPPGFDMRAFNSTPEEVTEFFSWLGPLQQVNCAVQRVCAVLTRSGELWAWGEFGERYDPNIKIPLRRFNLTKVPLPSRVTYLNSSRNMIYALLDDGRLVVFPGYPTEPQLLDIKKVMPAAPPGTALTCLAK
jgi:hypothetical protein